MAGQIDRYLERIGTAGRPEPSLAGLTALHRAHLRAIPYENLDVQLKRRLTTDPQAAYDKLVTRRRGGWCYEMNGLFGWALGQLGFDVTRATGAVMREVKGEPTVGNHLVLRVALDEGLFLADVGFGDGPHDPIRLVPGPFESNGFAFDVAAPVDGWWRFVNHPRGGARSFDFNLAPADESRLAERCRFLQTAEQSPFVQNLVAQRHTGEGMQILRGRVLRSLTPDTTDERLIGSANDLLATLGDTFGLDVPEAAQLWPAICERHEIVQAQKRAAQP